MNKYDLSGRKAVITGGATGIGYATAERFLKSGADVEIWARNVKNLEAAQKSLSEFGKVTFNSVDVSDWDQVQAGAEKAIKTHGKVDILFNNAGLALEVAPMLDTSIENWKNTIAINLDSVYYCCKVFVPAMVERGYGLVFGGGRVGLEGRAPGRQDFNNHPGRWCGQEDSNLHDVTR